jgi:hypothetical protein
MWRCIWSSGPHPFNWDEDPVASTRKRLDILGVIGRISQDPPQVSDDGVDAMVEIHLRIIRPQLALDFVARHQFACVLRKQQEHTKWLFLK